MYQDDRKSSISQKLYIGKFILNSFQNIALHFGLKMKTALFEGMGGVCISLMWTGPDNNIVDIDELILFVCIHGNRKININWSEQEYNGQILINPVKVIFGYGNLYIFFNVIFISLTEIFPPESSWLCEICRWRKPLSPQS